MLIYHHAGILHPGSAIASGVRPYRLKKAFERIGEEVFEVSGDGKARLEKWPDFQRLLDRKPDDLVFYSESRNIPPAMSWLAKQPWHMNFDYKLITELKKKNVPMGVFYRDIHWMFERKRGNLRSRIKGFFTPMFGRQELRLYQKNIDRLFLPHELMAESLPVKFEKERVCRLPPGGEMWDALKEPSSDGPLKLFYVGNIVPPNYDLRPFIDVLGKQGQVHLQLVTRKDSLTRFGHIYDFESKPNIELLHLSSDELKPCYEEAEIALSVHADHGYRAFAMPVKIFEAVSFGKPLIVSESGAAVADFVRDEKIGWVVRNAEEFSQLLTSLSGDRSQIAAMRENVLKIRKDHTWEARARTVLEELRGLVR